MKEKTKETDEQWVDRMMVLSENLAVSSPVPIAKSLVKNKFNNKRATIHYADKHHVVLAFNSSEKKTYTITSFHKYWFII